MGYNNKVSSPYEKVYKEDEIEVLLNEPSFLSKLVRLREMYKDFPEADIPGFLGCRFVSKEVFGSKKIPLIRLVRQTKSGNVEFCLYKPERSKFWSLVWNGQGFEPKIC